MPKGNYGANNVRNFKSQFNSKPCNNSFSKDEEDIYSPKVYAKKKKEKSMFDDIVMPEYMMDKQKTRDKRQNDQKYKNKGRRDY
jgi:hypothetical protein